MLYADDICILSNCKNAANTALIIAKLYAEDNEISLNTEKSVYISEKYLALSINGIQLKRVDKVKYLGLITDIKGINPKKKLILNWSKTLAAWNSLSNIGL